MQNFSARFNKVYDAMPSDIKPPLGWALLHYPSSFDPEVEFHIRQKEPLSLEEMQDIAIAIEYNIQCREERLQAERKDRTKQTVQISLEDKLERLIETASSLLKEKE